MVLEANVSDKRRFDPRFGLRKGGDCKDEGGRRLRGEGKRRTRMKKKRIVWVRGKNGGGLVKEELESERGEGKKELR